FYFGYSVQRIRPAGAGRSISENQVMWRLDQLKLPFLALLAACVLATTAYAQSPLDRARKDGYIRVGFPNQVPYAYADEKGQLTGADAVIARMVVQKMGVKEMDGVLTE